ncbi:MAG: hypothetical protein ACOYB0_08195 [Polynucleobacter sp.]
MPTITGRWRRDGSTIGGATAIDYTLVDDDYNHVIDYEESATNSAGTATLDSNNFLVESARPIPATLPYIVVSQNPPVPGAVWTATPGVYIGTQPIAVVRAWLADGVPIAGETGLTYTTAAGDVGKVITYRETANNSVGPRVTVIDAGLGPIQGPSGPVATTPPAIVVDGGGSIKTNSNVTATPGVWSGSPTVTGAWYKNGIPIAGATALTYALAVTDEGGTITYRERATNVAGAAQSPSNELGPVALVQSFVTQARDAGTPGVVGYTTSAGGAYVDTMTRAAAAAAYTGIRLGNAFTFNDSMAHIVAFEVVVEGPIVAGASGNFNGCAIGFWQSCQDDIPGGASPFPASFPQDIVMHWTGTNWVFISNQQSQYASGNVAFGVGDVLGFALDFRAAASASPTLCDMQYRMYRNGVLLGQSTQRYENRSRTACLIPYLIAFPPVTSATLRAIIDPEQMAFFDSYGADFGYPDAPRPRRRLPELMQEPVISGTTVVGQTLSCVAGVWQPATSDPGGLTITGNWYRDNSIILGTQNAGTYAVVAADVGHLITYRESALSATGRLSDLWSSDGVGPVTAT